MIFNFFYFILHSIFFLCLDNHTVFILNDTAGPLQSVHCCSFCEKITWYGRSIPFVYYYIHASVLALNFFIYFLVWFGISVQKRGYVDLQQASCSGSVPFCYGATLPKDSSCSLLSSWAMTDPSTFLIRSESYLHDNLKVIYFIFYNHILLVISYQQMCFVTMCIRLKENHMIHPVPKQWNDYVLKSNIYDLIIAVGSFLSSRIDKSKWHLDANGSCWLVKIR